MTTPGDATPQAAPVAQDARGQGAAGLNPAADRKRREAERLERKRQADAARMAAKRAAAKSPAPVVALSREESLPPSPARSDEQRAADGAVFLRALYRVAGFVADFLGYEVTPLSATEASEDATYLVPLARRYLWMDSALTFVGAPAALVIRFASHLRKKPEPRAEDGDVVPIRKEQAQ